MYPLGLMTMTLFRCIYDSLWAHGRVVHSILGSRGVVTAENWCPMPNLASLVRRHGPWYLVAGGDPGMIECLECSPTRLVLARSWSHTVLMERDYSITELRSGHDRPLSLCVLSLAAWFRARNSVDRRVAASSPPPPPKQLPPRGARW